LITGASCGLGKDFAYELASRRYNLLLVSLKDEGLPGLCTELSDLYDIKADYFEADLSEPDTVFMVADWAISKGHVAILVNNAGIGGTKAFDDASVKYIDNIIQINIRATSLLTRLMLPELKRHDNSYILNVTSTASFSPVAYKTVYPASKAFIWSFSKGLAEELKNTGIHVSVVSPGPMRTNADVTMRIENQSMIGRLGVMTTRKTARIAVNRLFLRNRLIIPGLFNKINWLLSKLVPLPIRLALVSKVMKKDLENYALPVK
ncbi:MAG TPA: SDR family NAD(P)-dependent oxidoreductase, partial [Bacteroidales bacterium]|nr:SDR family NAD(P)-dependent oxidoreductase [Bacteroidales bacterium]